MNLVNDDHLAHEPKVAHQNVSGFQGCEQHLVDRADHDGRQCRAPPLPHPPAGMQAHVLLVVVHLEGTLAPVEELHERLVEVVLPVCELDAQLLRLVPQDAGEPARHALEHCVRRGLRGQRDEHSLQPPSAHEHLGDCEGQLGLPRAGRGLDDHKVRVLRGGDVHSLALGAGRLVRGRPPEAAPVQVSGRVGERRGRAQGRRESRSLPAALGALALLVGAQLWITANRAFSICFVGTRTQRKVVLVRGKPVRDDERRGVGRGNRDG